PKRRFPSAKAFGAALRDLAGARGALSAWIGGLAPMPESPAANPPDIATGGALPPNRGREPRIPSHLVLPPPNRPHDAAQDFFTDGMTDALIADLAQLRALRVISRTSAMRYRGSTLPLPAIAKELNVEAVVEGSVMRSGDRVRITVQLVEAATDSTLWAKS